MKTDFDPAALFDLDQTDHRALFEHVTHAWEALALIDNYLRFRLRPGMEGRQVGRAFISNAVYVAPGTVVEQGAVLRGPAWIGRNCEIRAGAYVRQNVIIGDDVVIGNSCEIKNSIIFNAAQIPHFNYVGDSILGHGAHLGAGSILSNVRLDRGEVQVRLADGRVATGLRKFGALIGDFAEIGCNAVINPGSVIGRRSLVHPGLVWTGVLPEGHVARTVQTIEVGPRRV